MSKSLAVTSEVRAWFVRNPKSFNALSPAAQRTVVRTDGGLLRGRLHPEAIALHNQRNRKAEYVLGATAATAASLRKAAASDRKAAARKAARKGQVVGKRGPLPKAFAVTHKG